MSKEAFNFVGKLLIAMPNMADPRFDRSVVYMCSHSKQGALGLIVNKTHPKLQFVKILQQLKIGTDNMEHKAKVYYGGPVETVRGIVLHTDDYRTKISTVDVADNICITATMDILRDIAIGKGPITSLLALGYAGWSEGQLENEIIHNGWLFCDADQKIVFGANNDDKWVAALASIGVSPELLSSTTGHA